MTHRKLTANSTNSPEAFVSGLFCIFPCVKSRTSGRKAVDCRCVFERTVWLLSVCAKTCHSTHPAAAASSGMVTTDSTVVMMNSSVA